MGEGFPNELLLLYKFFIRNYISSDDFFPRFPPYLWSIYDFILPDMPKTNNAIEGWHNAFKGRLSRTTSSMAKLIDCLFI